MATDATARAGRIPVAWRARAAEALDAAGIAGLAGLIAGLLAAGVGGRVAMRIAGAMSDPTLVGAARTENGNILGDVTFGGTLFLLIAGTFIGSLAGLLYAVVRPWLRPLGRWGGLLFGLALLAALGQIVLEPSNFDFGKFGVPALNVALFALLFPLFGVLCAFAVTRIEGAVRDRPMTSPWGIAVVLAQLLLGLFVIYGVIGTGVLVARLLSGELTIGGGGGDGRGLILPYFLIVAVGSRALLGPTFHDARTLASVPRAATYALLLVPAILGLPRLVFAIRSLVAS